MEAGAETRHLAAPETPRADGVWWGWALLVGVLLLMFGGGLLGPQGILGGALIFGGFIGTCGLGLVSPIMALAYFARRRTGLGFQAAALTAVVWVLLILLLAAGLRA